jgi:hypothetical protein
MGICAGAGYTANAATNDPRIKAVGTVSMVNIGQMFRNGFTGDVKSAETAPLIANGAKARTAEANGGEINKMPLAPMRKEDAPNADLEEAGILPHIARAISDRARLGNGAKPQPDHSVRCLHQRGSVPYAALDDGRGRPRRQQMDE